LRREGGAGDAGRTRVTPFTEVTAKRKQNKFWPQIVCISTSASQVFCWGSQTKKVVTKKLFDEVEILFRSGTPKKVDEEAKKGHHFF